MKKNTSFFRSTLTALALLGLLSIDGMRAAVLVDLNFGSDTAANSGSFGNGTVALNGIGSWTNVNATGNPAGRAFDTGANAMGSLATNTPSGTISWTHAQGSMDGLSQFSSYMWVNPATLPANGGTLLSYGNGNVLQVLLTVSTTPRLGVKVNGVEKDPIFTNLDSSAIGQWLFVGLSFDNGTLTTFVGQAGASNLSVNTTTGYDAALNSNATGLILLNNTLTGTRPFDGALGEFYLSDATSTSAALEALFDTQKSGYIAVPEPSGLSLMVLFGVVLFGLSLGKKRYLRSLEA